MRSIFWFLALLIALFSTGMLLLSHLNLSYSQQAMSALRRDQIEDVFFASLARIDARQIALERHTGTLANIGESFYRLSRDTPQGTGARQKGRQAALRAQLEAALGAHLRDFEGAFAAGVWFEPGILAPAGETYAPYLTKTESAPVPQLIESPQSDGLYQSEPWFKRTLGANWTVAEHTPNHIYWSPVYFDFAARRALLTLASPMFDAEKNLIGMVTTGWASDQIIDFVSRVEVTETSFSFLNDRNNRNLSSLSRNGDTLLEQKIIDAIRTPADRRAECRRAHLRALLRRHCSGNGLRRRRAPG